MQTISKFPELSELSCLTSLHVELFFAAHQATFGKYIGATAIYVEWGGTQNTFFYSLSFSRSAYFISIFR